MIQRFQFRQPSRCLRICGLQVEEGIWLDARILSYQAGCPFQAFLGKKSLWLTLAGRSLVGLVDEVQDFLPA